MPGPQSSSTLEYALVAIVVFAGVLALVAALWPMLQLIVDGFQILGQVFSGSFVPLK
jgi:hypothetical protein